MIRGVLFALALEVAVVLAFTGYLGLGISLACLAVLAVVVASHEEDLNERWFRDDR